MNRFAVVAVVLLLAGCARPDAEPDAGEVDGPTEPEPDAPPLQGFIFDPALRPIPDTTLTLVETGEAVQSDIEGHYAFDDPPIGDAFIVVAEAEGFVANSKRIKLDPATPVRVNFTLDPVPDVEPYHELTSQTAFINCQLTATVGEEDGDTYDCSGGTVEDHDTWEFAVGPDLAGIIVEVYWTPQQEGAKYARGTLETLGFGDLNTLLDDVEGQSPLRLQVSQSNAERFYSEGGRLRLSLSPSPNEDELEAGAGAAAAFQQEYEMFAGLFYIEPPHPTWTVEDG